ncbi:MAG: 16S rRNA (cytosine(1402)-N(4))-methyltransferase RsmH [Treponema sp.]|nr:16S rRNA (cytosine(1402)-N(4))-methyltransferase RsmH [Treponema sp.]
MENVSIAVHTPVLAEEVLGLLGPRGENELMIDATLGEGGHSFQFLSRFPGLKIIGVDADPEILKVAGERLKGFGDRIGFYSGWSYDFFKEYGPAQRPDTILIDLGVSLFHYEKSGRGFSFRRDEPLDMRINPDSGKSAADLVNGLPEKELADLLFYNAEERFSRRIAREIVRVRQQGAIKTSGVLAGIVGQAVPPAYRRGPVHPATKTFLALRIAVNGELSGLRELLEAALRVLKPGGRMGVISFHSLEDRIVKNFFRDKNRDSTCPPGEPICKYNETRIVNILTKKGVVAGQEEIQANPPSRSARLRAAEKIKDEEK